MRILFWHRHGSWATSFVQGGHDYLLPVLPGRPRHGLGRARTWTWPDRAVERTPEQLREEHIDVVVLQRADEIPLVTAWTGRRPGVDLPAVFVEHIAPHPHPVDSRHPLADRADIPLVHVAHFNALYWDNGIAPTTVIEHGIPDPGYRYTGELARAAVVGNDIATRGRTLGADLLAGFARVGPLDVFGGAARGVRALFPSSDAPAGAGRTGDAGTGGAIDGGAQPGGGRTPDVQTFDELPDQEAMFALAAQRRVYLHLCRWTSLGLSLIEAMHLGLPVVALAATDAVEAVPPGAGTVSTDLRRLHLAMADHLADPEAARIAGRIGRAHARERYGLDRFLAEWDQLLTRVV